MLVRLYFEIMLIAISLSMDAFSLAISISSTKLNKYSINTYSLIVGLFHFFMPILGHLLKDLIQYIILVPPKVIFVVVIVIIIMGIVLDKEKNLTGKILNPLVFGFTVSVDSFSLGITLSKNMLLSSCIIFSAFSCMFTFFGFKIGNIFNKNMHKYTKVISISILIMVLILKLI